MGSLSHSQLRRWQVEALAAWESTERRGIIEVATGAGKTRFALAAARLWIDTNPTGALVVIVPTSALQDQWVIELSEEMNVDTKAIGTWPGNTDKSARFHVLIVNTARTIAAQLFKGRNVFLVADECHRYATPKNICALEVEPSSALGLTATAERQYDDGLYDLLVPMLGPIFFKYDIRQARIDGVVTPFNIVNVETELSDDEQDQYDRLTRQLARAIDDGEDDAAKRISLKRSTVTKSAWMRIPASIALMEKLRGRRCLVFHEDIMRAEMITKLLRERRHSVAAYHSQMGDAIRRDNLRSFRDGMTDILVTCRALDEGVDVPDADCAIIVAATASNRQRVQRLGRVLRSSKSKEMATVYTLYATGSEHDRLRDEQGALGDAMPGR